jgi:hypothetical protein
MVRHNIVSFGLILSANVLQNRIACRRATFVVNDFINRGIPVTRLGYSAILLLGTTDWKWLEIIQSKQQQVTLFLLLLFDYFLMEEE